MNAENIAYDSKVAANYDKDREVEEHWGRENEFILRYFRGKSVRRILDVPVGTGRFIGYYPRTARVVGIDVSPHMIEQARNAVDLLDRHGVELRIGDASDLGSVPDGSVDVIVCCRLLHLVRNDERLMFLREFARVLGGELILQVYLDLPRRNIFLRGLARLRRELKGLFTKPVETRTPWAHIESYGLSEAELQGLLSAAGLAVVTRTRLCIYGGSEVVMLVLRNAR